MNQFEMKKLLVRALTDWIRANGLTYAKAADRLGITPSQMGEIMRHKCRYTAGWLLDRWVLLGGEAQLILRPPPELESSASQSTDAI